MQFSGAKCRSPSCWLGNSSMVFSRCFLFAPLSPGAHFTVIDPELDRGFISNGGAARLTVFNTKTLETIGEVKSTGENPGPTVFDAATKRVFTFNLNSHNATVVDSKEGNVVGTYVLGAS